jgi:hypothetical protein
MPFALFEDTFLNSETGVYTGLNHSAEIVKDARRDQSHRIYSLMLFSITTISQIVSIDPYA